MLHVEVWETDGVAIPVEVLPGEVWEPDGVAVPVEVLPGEVGEPDGVAGAETLSAFADIVQEELIMPPGHHRLRIT